MYYKARRMYLLVSKYAFRLARTRWEKNQDLPSDHEDPAQRCQRSQDFSNPTALSRQDETENRTGKHDSSRTDHPWRSLVSSLQVRVVR